MKSTNYVGFCSKGQVVPFGTIYGTPSKIYVFDLANNCFLHADGSTCSHDWNLNDIDTQVRLGVWGYMTEEDVKKYFSLFQTQAKTQTKTPMPQVAGLSPRPVSIKKGTLYFNTTSSLVERVITVQDGSLVWSSHHKAMARPYPKTAFRLATKDEVAAYLALIA